jgi:hypothetical protein
MATTKLDLTKEYKAYFTVKKTPEVVEFDEAQFLTAATSKRKNIKR